MDFSIGELAKRTGVKIPTIRYYEKEGLIEEPVRTEGNQRRYSPDDLEQLQFIKHARDLGIPMDAVRDLLALNKFPDQRCEAADRIASAQLQNIRIRIAQLRQLEAELERITASCTGDHTIADCNVLKAFGNHALCRGDH